MSLLLDALKKAAEKKAENGDKRPDGAAVDETVVDATQVDATEQFAEGGSEDTMQVGSAREETQLEKTELDQTRVDSPVGDDTDLGQQSLHEAMNADVSDETIVDQTLLDQTEFDQTELQPEQADVQQEAAADDLTHTQSSDTDLMGTEDQTMVFDDEDVSEFLGDPRYINQEATDDTDVATQSMPAGDATDMSTQSMPVGDDTETGAPPLATGDDTDIAELDHGEDMSLLLVDDEQTQTGVKTLTSVTDPKQPPRRGDLLQENAGLSLEGDTQTAGSGPTTKTAGSVTTQVGGSAEPTATRVDSTATATATYAPDNYDRTLMRVQNDDASKLFAGMQSETDTVMTPDYAKKVFQSKSSANTWQSFRLYSGVAVVMLLAVGILGLFEFQAKVDNIDNQLRPLARDPMPGPIVTARQDEGSELFTAAPTEVDEKTRMLVETANEVVEEPVVSEEQAVEDTQVASVVESEPVEQTATSADQAVTEPLEPTTSEPAPSIEVATVATTESAQEAASAEVDAPVPDSSLSITTSTRTADKDIWLREAYAAYRAGNDELALQRYNQVLEVEPGNRNALLARAAIAIQDNRGNDAVRDYQRLLEANPRDSLAMSSLIAVSSVAPRQAESQLKLMLREEPGSPHLNFALGNVYSLQNRWQEAQRYYFTALENNPDDPNYAFNLAVSLERISQPEVAADFYQRALDNFELGLATFNRDVVEQRLGVLQ